MPYFVTGGAGFIGGHLVNGLIADGNQVTVFDNLSSEKKEFIEQHIEGQLQTSVLRQNIAFPRLSITILNWNGPYAGYEVLTVR